MSADKNTKGILRHIYAAVIFLLALRPFKLSEL